MKVVTVEESDNLKLLELVIWLRKRSQLRRHVSLPVYDHRMTAWSYDFGVLGQLGLSALEYDSLFNVSMPTEEAAAEHIATFVARRRIKANIKGAKNADADVHRA